MTAAENYDKLIRDRIPELIESSGKECTVRELEGDEYSQKLKQKLLEEVKEYLESGKFEEIVDIFEVLRYLVKAHDKTIEELEELRQDKKEKRGGFEKGLLLQEVRG